MESIFAFIIHIHVLNYADYIDEDLFWFSGADSGIGLDESSIKVNCLK